jgi:hypothetical protein
MLTNDPREETLTQPGRCAPGVKWAVETCGLTLFLPEHGACCCIPYPLAATWDLLHRGYRLDEAIRLTSQIAGVSLDEARRRVTTAFADWVALGVLMPEGGHGESVADFRL